MKKPSTPPDWSQFVKRPTWASVSSRELASVFGVHLQTINNWHIRGHLPSPEARFRKQGNRNMYQIAKIRAWLENKTEDEIHWEFIRTHLAPDIKCIPSAMNYARICWEELEIEKH
jgi:transposase